MKKIIFASILTMATSFSMVAHAEGGYAGIAIEKSNYTYDAPGAVSDKSKASAGTKIFGGYEFIKNIGLEAGYADHGNEKYNFSVGGLPGSLDGRSTSFYLAGRFNLPINDMFSVYSKLGAARNHFAATSAGIGPNYIATGNKTGVYAALGLEYNINKNVALGVEYESYGKMNHSTGNSNFLSLGLRYKF